MIKIRMKEGAPPDSELSVCFSVRRTYVPKPEDYKSNDNPNGHMTKLGYLLHDKECIVEGYYMVDELLDLQSEGYETIFELVDSDGNVWTEEYDDGIPDTDQISARVL